MGLSLDHRIVKGLSLASVDGPAMCAPWSAFRGLAPDALTSAPGLAGCPPGGELPPAVLPGGPRPAQRSPRAPRGPPQRPVPIRPLNAAAHGRFPSRHINLPNDSQEECVTRRSVLAIPWRTCYHWFTFRPDVAPCAAGTGRHGQTRADSARGDKHDTTDDGRVPAFGPAVGRARRGGDAGGGACLARQRQGGYPAPQLARARLYGQPLRPAARRHLVLPVHPGPDA